MGLTMNDDVGLNINETNTGHDVKNAVKVSNVSDTFNNQSDNTQTTEGNETAYVNDTFRDVINPTQVSLGKDMSSEISKNGEVNCESKRRDVHKVFHVGIKNARHDFDSLFSIHRFHFYISVGRAF